MARDMGATAAMPIRRARIPMAVAVLPLPFACAEAALPGDLAPTFGAGGKVTTDFRASDVARALIVQPDGALVATGQSGDIELDFALARQESALRVGQRIELCVPASIGTGDAGLEPARR